MAEVSAILASVLRNLSDKLYEKRKNAALDVEGIVKQLAAADDKINAVFTFLTNEYTISPQANHLKGGLIELAAATVGLSSKASQHLEQNAAFKILRTRLKTVPPYSLGSDWANQVSSEDHNCLSNSKMDCK